MKIAIETTFDEFVGGHLVSLKDIEMNKAMGNDISIKTARDLAADIRTNPLAVARDLEAAAEHAMQLTTKGFHR